MSPLARRHLIDVLREDQTIGEEGDSALGDFIEDSETVVALDVVSLTLLLDPGHDLSLRRERRVQR